MHNNVTRTEFVNDIAERLAPLVANGTLKNPDALHTTTAQALKKFAEEYQFAWLSEENQPSVAHDIVQRINSK